MSGNIGSAKSAVPGGRHGALASVVVSCWALLFGVALVMLSNGLHGALIGIRANIEGFATSITGIVMSGYFIGFAVGSFMAPRLLHRVGHVRVFAALASIASVATLIYPILPDPISWFLMRVLTGIAYSGLYIVAESWLNDVTTNDNRGSILSIYLAIALGGMGLGPLMLNMADPSDFTLFIIMSALVSIALIPILLTIRPAPRFDAPRSLSIKELFEVSPLGVVSCILSGMCNGAFLGIAAVYGQAIGLSVGEISLFMTAAVLGGGVIQWPIGWISDRFDRRIILMLTTFTAAGTALLALAAAEMSVMILLGAVFIYGGFHFPMYSLSIAHTNDHLEQDQMVAASSAIVFLSGVSASFGPIIVAATMDYIGDYTYFVVLAILHATVGVFALYRMSQRASVSLEEQAPAQFVTRTSAVVVAEVMDIAQEQWEEAQEEEEEEEEAEGEENPDQEKAS